MSDQFFVSPEWLHEHLNDDKLVILDHPYGLNEYIKDKDEDKREYAKEHIPGAICIEKEELQGYDTDLNLYPAEKLKEMFLSKGVDSETLLVAYSDGIIASSRVALAAYWLGVKEVKILLGGIQGWKQAGYPVTAEPVQAKVKADFLCPVPQRPEIILSTPEDVVRYKEDHPEFLLANIRSWDEYVGTQSGYPYIKDTGAPLGSVYAKASSNRVNVEYILDEAGNFGDLSAIFSEWAEWGIDSSKDLAFFCGAGWRAATVFFVLKQLGWEHVKVYDGGWYQWNKYYQDNPSRYPIQTGDPRSSEGIRVHNK